MTSKKGLCPISMVWRGFGIGGALMKAGLIGLLFLLLLRFALSSFSHQSIDARPYLIATASLWLIGFALNRLGTSIKKE